MTEDYEREKKHHERIKRGLYTIQMLFGAVNMLREQLGLHQYAHIGSLRTALFKRGIKPVEVTGGGRFVGAFRHSWYNKEQALKALTFDTQRGCKADHFNFQAATMEQIATGEWLDLATCAKLSGARKVRIANFKKHHSEYVRLHPYTGVTLFYFPELLKFLHWRPFAFLQKKLGLEVAEGMQKIRKTRYTGDTWARWGNTALSPQKLLIYAPELAHL